MIALCRFVYVAVPQIFSWLALILPLWFCPALSKSSATFLPWLSIKGNSITTLARPSDSQNLPTPQISHCLLLVILIKYLPVPSNQNQHQLRIDYFNKLQTSCNSATADKLQFVIYSVVQPHYNHCPLIVWHWNQSKCGWWAGELGIYAQTVAIVPTELQRT